MNILVSAPTMPDWHVLPMVFGIMKSSCDADPVLKKKLNWLDPVVFEDAPERVLEQVGADRIDVLALSCQVWTSEFNMRLAAEVKRRFPDCVVLAGGPDPDYKVPGYFSRYPLVDVLSISDAEASLPSLMRRLVEGSREFEDLPGLFIRDASSPSGGRATERPSPPPLLEESPWIANEEYYLRIIERARGLGSLSDVVVAWETDRGCPFGCKFCDWGASNTLTRVRTAPMDRLKAEVDWFGRIGVKAVIMATANFGIFKRDPEILEALIDAKRRHGLPYSIVMNTSKANAARVTEVNVRAYESGLIDHCKISVQNLDGDVLDAMKRTNLPDEDHRELVSEMARRDIPMAAELIVGCPGDTPDKWRSTLTDLMEWGIHSQFFFYPYSLLPNAPASEPEYLEKWKIETVTRRVVLSHRGGGYNAKLVSESSSFSREDLVQMNLEVRLLNALHASGLVSWIARHWRKTHGISFREFYDALIDDGMRPSAGLLGSVYREAHARLSGYMLGEDSEATEVASLGAPFAPELEGHVEDLVLFRFLFEADRFYAELADFLRQRFPEAGCLDSLVRFQKSLLLTPDYDRRRGRNVFLDRDWPAHFLSESEAEPKPFSRKMLSRIDRQACGKDGFIPLDWNEFEGGDEDRLSRWCRTAVPCERANHVDRSAFPLTALGPVEPVPARYSNPIPVI